MTLQLPQALQAVKNLQYTMSSLSQRVSVTRPDGVQQRGYISVGLYRGLNTAIRLLKEGKLTAPLLTYRPGNKKRIYIQRKGRTKLFYPPARYTPRRAQKFEPIKWDQIAGIADVTYTKGGTFSCRFRRRGRVTFTRMRSNFTVYNAQGKVVGKRSFTASRVCPAFMMSGFSTRDYSSAWKPWLRQILRKL